MSLTKVELVFSNYPSEPTRAVVRTELPDSPYWQLMYNCNAITGRRHLIKNNGKWYLESFLSSDLTQRLAPIAWATMSEVMTELHEFEESVRRQEVIHSWLNAERERQEREKERSKV